MENLLNTTVKVFEDGISIIEDAKISIDNLSEAVVIVSDKMEELSLTNDINKKNISYVISELEETAKSQKYVLELAQNKVSELKEEEKDKAGKISSIIESFVNYAEDINNRLKGVLEGLDFNSENMDFSQVEKLSKKIAKKVEQFNKEISRISNISHEVENIKNNISVIDEANITSKINLIAEMITSIQDKTSKLDNTISESDSKLEESNILKNIDIVKDHFKSVVNEIEIIFEKTKSIDDDYNSLNEKLSSIIQNKCNSICEALDKINIDNLSNSELVSNSVREIKSINDILMSSITEINSKHDKLLSGVSKINSKNDSLLSNMSEIKIANETLLSCVSDNKYLNEELLNISRNNSKLTVEIDNKSSSIIKQNNKINDSITNLNDIINNNIQKNILDLDNRFNDNINSLNSDLNEKFKEIENYNKSINEIMNNVIDDEVNTIKIELEKLRNENKELHKALNEVIERNDRQQNETLNQLKKLNIELFNELKISQRINKELLEKINNDKTIYTISDIVALIAKKLDNLAEETKKVKLQNTAISKNIEKNNNQLIENIKGELKKVQFSIETINNNKSRVSEQVSINTDNSKEQTHIYKGNMAFNNSMYEEAYMQYKAGAEKKEMECIGKLKKFEEFAFNEAKNNNLEFTYIAGKIEEDKFNYSNAVKLYNQAGRKGNEKAKKSYLDLCKRLSKTQPEFFERLGDAYYYGKIVKQDKEIAKEYYTKAAAAGCVTATEKLKLYYIALKNLKL